MSDFETQSGAEDDEGLEILLSHALPRPIPDAAATTSARDAVRSEWIKVTRRRRRRGGFAMAMAATVLVAAFLFLGSEKLIAPEPVNVASVQKTFGSVFAVTEESQLLPIDGLRSIRTGQAIVTGSDAGMAVAWHSGGSLRVGADTELEFTDEQSVHLRRGRIYFDSTPAPLLAGITGGGSPEFTITTEFGKVNHIGTQFMTKVHDDKLTVTVREGEVKVDGDYHSSLVARGQQVVFDGNTRPTKLSVGVSDESWYWIGGTSPAVDVTGRTIHEFLTWATRELGYELRFDNAAAEREALDKTLQGEINVHPADALPAWMSTTNLDWSIEKGVINVSKSE